MISGFKDWHQNVKPHIGKVWLAAGIFAVIAAIAFMIV
jgi:hypothetical protein